MPLTVALAGVVASDCCVVNELNGSHGDVGCVFSAQVSPNMVLAADIPGRKIGNCLF